MFPAGQHFSRCRRQSAAACAHLFLAVLLFAAPRLEADTGPDAIVREALAAESRFDAKHALELFLEADHARPQDPFILQKISRQYSDLSEDITDVAEKRRLCTEALRYAERATKLQPGNAVNVLSIAICHGKLALLSDNRGKVEHSRLMHDYAEQALALNPNNDYAHDILGRWNYEVASLGPAKRFLVRMVYGGLPAASTAEAVRQLRRAVELAPEVPAHRVELGFALLADGQRDAARQTFEQALAMPMHEKYDDRAFQRAREALKSLR